MAIGDIGKRNISSYTHLLLVSRFFVILLTFRRYEADHVYGHATICFMCAVIGVFMLSNIVSKVSKRSKSSTTSGNSLMQRGLATSRLLSYKSFHVRGLGWYSPPLGVILLGLCGVIYFFCEYLLNRRR